MSDNNQNIHEPDFSNEEMKMPEGAAVPETEEKISDKSPFGIVIVVLVVLLLAILAGLYFWYSSLVNQPVAVPAPTERPTAEENNEPESTTAEAQADTLNVVSTSDELQAIEADIESTDLDSLDAELEAIDAELEAALEAI
ncbi:MAG: hypothetical protein AAGA35_04020 [Patescibacteria group bacterium]